jgi:pyruvyltransferase
VDPGTSSGLVRSGPARRLAKALVGRQLAARRQRPERLRRIVDDYRVSNLIETDGRVPLVWWRRADNFGDLLSPWLISKMTGRDVVYGDPAQPHYLAIGSILRRAQPQSQVWGAGCFGTERAELLASEATYCAVRGPLSRARLVALGVPCPPVYGDPALLVPAYFAPKVEKTHAYGIVARWSEHRWLEAEIGPDVKVISLGTTDVEGVIEAMLSCRRIVTSSLHGLVIADTFGIPSAWVMSLTAHGGAYKYFDYFSTVNKFRNPRDFDSSRPVTAQRLRDSFDFDGRPIEFDYYRFLDACPFLERR